ncbi:hypothetical protein ITP53_27045 [Nonomuraea sp. K274]|uniref:Uncharacterized protein n=1 Tax=Nonomuraea cypriaca TaxID=1187855 RepID=A0A931ADX3_9ACTN|nr:hypothetical protein [Nonomuraea cypriaca]MBF8189324.1 hypothetical protein [Nonomuraea cypriaca]
MTFPAGFLWGAGGLSRRFPGTPLMITENGGVYATGTRTIKDSGRYYAQLIAGGGTAPVPPKIEAFG